VIENCRKIGLSTLWYRICGFAGRCICSVCSTYFKLHDKETLILGHILQWLKEWNKINVFTCNHNLWHVNRICSATVRGILNVGLNVNLEKPLVKCITVDNIPNGSLHCTTVCALLCLWMSKIIITKCVMYNRVHGGSVGWALVLKPEGHGFDQMVSL
jgi:hypothetical protein